MNPTFWSTTKIENKTKPTLIQGKNVKPTVEAVYNEFLTIPNCKMPYDMNKFGKFVSDVCVVRAMGIFH